ncbi:archaeosortase/exosortase family protein [Mesorhizobium loti]|uniref:archaeosortase/exosortase family protein n=1 Tax=Rhizobium loti TaxID=381 RepID=UPI00047BA8DE|nr:archaeosortase/exosortase family protein [Mesorhizobium loti]
MPAGIYTSRTLIYCGLAIVGFANGASERIAAELDQKGALAAFYNTFGVSTVVWAALFVVVCFLLRSNPQPMRRIDIAIAASAAIAILLPLPALSWLAITMIAIHLACSSRSTDLERRAGAVLGAATVPMLWARVLFASMSNSILVVDAKLVGWLVGTNSHGNVIPFADGSGMLFLEPACSSLTNVSLAYLCGVLFLKIYDRNWSLSAIKTIVLACVVTISLNVIRISSICLLPRYYDEIHGPMGATLAGWATMGIVLAIYTRGIKPNATPRT